MKKSIFSLVLGLLLSQLAVAQAVVPAFFTKADAFLKKNVTTTGGVDYDGLRSSRAEMDALVKDIATFPLASQTAASKKAFYINAYNILTIFNVVNHMPLAKPTDVAGFFDKITFNVAGEQLTLSDIENKKIRPVYNDARVHFALVCAGRGCPPLLNAAYMPGTVDAQLDARTKLAVNDANWTKVNASSSTIQLSEIFKWYEADFTAKGGALAFVNQYRTTKVPTTYRVSFYTYDWTLNKKVAGAN